MSGGGPVERVVAMLKDAGYVPVEQPQSIAGIPFEFAAMLVGDTSLDLVAVLDLAIDAKEERIRRRINGLARALDVVGSRRSLTVVLVGPRPSQGLIQEIGEVSRVLAVGTPVDGDDAFLWDALASLLPLQLVTETEHGAKGREGDWAEVRDRLRKKYPTELAPILAVSGRGEGAVREALRTVLSMPVDEMAEANEDGVSE